MKKKSVNSRSFGLLLLKWWVQMIRLRYISVFALFLTVSVSLIGMAIPAGVESFESGVPQHFETLNPGSLSISTDHFLHGNSSLRWDWSKGDVLTIRHSTGDPGRTGGFLNSAAFVVCLYQKAAGEGALRFVFKTSGAERGRFAFPLQFRGWQPARMFYKAFFKGDLTVSADLIEIHPPETGVAGTVFFDLIRYNALVYYSAGINPETMLNRQLPFPDREDFPGPHGVTEAERRALLRLLETAGGAGKFNDQRVDGFLEQLDATGIVREGQGVRGPALVRSSFYFAAPGEFGGKDVRAWPDENGPEGIEVNLPAPQTITRLADNIASAWCGCSDEIRCARLREGFLLLADHLFDQGLSVSMGSIIWLGKDPELRLLLKEHLERQLFELAAERFFVDKGREVQANMDFYASSGPYRLRNMLNICLAQADEREQVRWLNAWKALLERSLLQPGSPFKPDGSTYHHGGHYPSYGQNGLARLAILLLELKDTPWFPSEEALERVYRGLMAQRFYHNLTHKPVSLAGRSPFAGGIYDGLLPGFGDEAFATMARLGKLHEPDLNKEIAAAYLRLAPDGRQAESFREAGVVAEAHPEGTFVMPYAALLSHRRDDWLVCVKGQSCYVWGSERQARRNAYGLFMGLGNLEVLAGGQPVTASASGRAGTGWDWCRFEGVTAPRLSLPELDRGWSFVSGTVRSTEAFAGGLSHRGRQGVFGMILNQRIAPDQHRLSGRKSWFFEDNVVVCLGSDLDYSDKTRPLQTTICQKFLTTNEAGAFPPTPLNGKMIAAMPWEHRLEAESAHWFLDIQDTGYYLPQGQNITVSRSRQKSRNVDDTEDTEGVFLTAWLEHDGMAGQGEYEYALQVRSGESAITEFAASPPYRVFQKDAAAHIVRFADGRWGCVLFSAAETVPYGLGSGDLLLLASADRGCLVMFEAVNNGILDMTVSDPDLNIVKNTSHERILRLKLRGYWELEKTEGILCAWPAPDTAGGVRVASLNNNHTELLIPCSHGTSYGLRLRQILR